MELERVILILKLLITPFSLRSLYVLLPLVVIFGEGARYHAELSMSRLV